jgi:hypothetical protein
MYDGRARKDKHAGDNGRSDRSQDHDLQASGDGYTENSQSESWVEPPVVWAVPSGAGHDAAIGFIKWRSAITDAAPANDFDG